MSVQQLGGPHPVLACVEAIAEALGEVAHVDPAFMTADDKRSALTGLAGVAAAVQEMQLRVLAAGQTLGDVADADASRDAAAWLAHHARLDPGRSRHLTRLAVAVQHTWLRVGEALREGRIDVDRAAVVVRALEELPDGLDAEVVTAAEARLVEDAARFAPRELRVLGRRVLAHVAPEVGEAHEAAVLAREDAHAEATTYLRFRRRGDGTVDLHGRLSELTAHRLTTYLDAFTSPCQHQPGQQIPDPQAAQVAQSGPTGRPYDQRLGDAFAAFLETADPDRMPLHGGDATTVVVTIDHQTLLDDLEAAGVALVDGRPITAAHARRLACTAGILPAVLGGDSQVLDLGRTRRLFTSAQRKALQTRHHTCTVEGCTIPATWCEAHHRRPWSHGGRTDLDQADLLCTHHHHRIHDPRYATTRHPDGTIRFHRRT